MNFWDFVEPTKSSMSLQSHVDTWSVASIGEDLLFSLQKRLMEGAEILSLRDIFLLIHY